jgi:hypothetical protein
MGTVILKDHNYTAAVELERKGKARVQQPCRLLQQLQCLILDWLISESSLQNQWHKFNIMSSGSQVPYRVWSRHGAFLEMNSHSRKH